MKLPETSCFRMPDQGPCFYCNAPAQKRPNKPAVCENCHQGIQKEKENILFDPNDITKARSNTLPPCQNCQSIYTLAVRRNDIRYAVTACIECQHRRVLTEAEYLQEWPDSDALPILHPCCDCGQPKATLHVVKFNEMICPECRDERIKRIHTGVSPE